MSMSNKKMSVRQRPDEIPVLGATFQHVALVKPKRNLSRDQPAGQKRMKAMGARHYRNREAKAKAKAKEERQAELRAAKAKTCELCDGGLALMEAGHTCEAAAEDFDLKLQAAAAWRKKYGRGGHAGGHL